MQEQDTSRRRKFYDQMSEAYDLGTFEEFDEKMNNPESRRKLHDFIDKDGKYDIGDFAYFDEAMRPAEPSAPQKPATQTTQAPAEYAQPTNAAGDTLDHNGQPYSQEVLRRYNSQDTGSGTFKDLSQIAKEVEREQMGPTDPALDEGARIGAGLGMIAAMQQQQPQPQQQDNPFSAENPSMMQPKPAEMPLMFKDVRQQSQNPELNKQWIKEKAAEEAIPADTNADFGKRMATLEKAGNAEAARLMNRKEYDQRNFDKFYEGHVAPVFGEEKSAGEKKVQEALAQSNKEDKAAGAFNIPTGGHAGFAKAFETAVAKEKYTDPKKIADATLKRVQDDNGAGGFGDYVLSRMGINGGTGEDDGSQPQLSEREKEWMKRLFAKETDEVASKIIDRIYDQYKQEDAPKSVLEYIGGKALHENMVSSLYDALVRRAAGSSEARAQLRAMAYEDFGKDQGWLARVAGGAAPFAVDMIAGGFALPNIVGKAVVKGGTKLAAREVTKQMERRAASRGLEDAALKEAVEGGEEVAQRYLATQAPILNLAINAAGSAANFATYDVQSEAIRQIANGEFKPVDIMKAAGHGAALGGVMGATGGAIANATRNSGLLGKIAGDVAGLGAETAIFGLSSGLQKAIDEGIDIADVDWADTTGEAFGTVVGMKTVGAVMHPKNFLDRYRKSKDYDLKLNQRDLDELKAAGYDLDGIFKGLGKFGEIKPMEGNTIGKAKEITIGNYGKEAKTEEAWVDADNYKAILENPEISTSAKRKIVYLATGKVLTPEPVFGATLNVDEDGHATITTTNAYGAPIETKDYKTEEEAQKDYEKLQQISRTNTVGGLERVAQVAGMPIVVDEAKGRTKNETGVDVDDLDQMSDLDDAHFNSVMDAYTKNLQDAYMEHFNERLKKFGEAKEDTGPTGNGGDAGGTGSEPVGGSGTTGEGEKPATDTGGGSTPPHGGTTGGGGTPPPPERTERRDAAYDRGMAVAENEADLPAIGQDARLATARLMQQMPDDDPQLAKVRNSIMQAVEAGDDEEADRLTRESNLSARQQEAVEQWRDAIVTQYGIDDAVTDQTAQFEEQRRVQLEAIADPQGNVTRLYLKDGSTAYYKSGDLTNHFGGVMAVTGNGETVQLPVRDIADIDQPINVDDILARDVEQYAADLTDRYQAMFDGTLLTAGQQVDMVMANQPFTAIVVGTDPAGNIIFQMEDGSQMPMRPEDAQAAIAEADNVKIQQQLQAEAESARLAEQQERFTNGIQGYAEGQPDLTAAGTDAKAAAEYLKEQFTANGQDPEKARKQYLTDIQNTKEQLKQRMEDAQQELARLTNLMAGNEDMMDAEDIERNRQQMSQLQQSIADIRQRQQKYGDLRRELMNADEVNQMEQERRKVIFKARSGYQPTLPQRNLLSGEDRIIMEDGRPNFGLTPVSNANNYLLNHFQESADAEQFVNEQRLALRNKQRDEVQPEINRRNDILNAYASGYLELTSDEVTQLTHEVADLEAQQDALSKEAIRLREIADGIASLYERNGREEQLTPAEQRGKALDKAASKEDKLRIARTLYNIYPEALDIINSQEPRDLEEFIADNLGLNSMNWEGYDMDDRHIAGVQEAVFGKKGATRGIGKGYTTNAFNQYLAPTGEGKGFDEIVHGIYESQPDIGDGKRWTTEDISNALQDMLRTAQKPSDISHRIIDNRIAEAEDIVQRQEELDREAEEEAKYQELQQWAEAHHLDPDEVEAYQDYLNEKPWEFDEEVINQIIADDEEKSNQSGKEMDSQHPDGSVGSEGEGGESQVPEVSPAEGTAENPPVAGQPGAEGSAGGKTLPDNDVLGGASKVVIQGLDGYTEKDVTDLVRQHFNDLVDDDGLEIVDMKVIGSRTNGTAKDDSDLDVLLEYKGDMSEDGLFNILNDEENRLTINGIPVDINPITKGKSGTIDQWLERNKDYQKKDASFPARLAKAKAETDTNPTQAQKEAGNYKMGHIKFGGYQMSIENPKGSTRSGVDKNGKPWSIEMQDTYGYIGKKYGTDGDHLDFFINDDADLDNFDGRVYVVDQKNEDGTFDEHKVMYGYPSWSAAKKAYERNYEPGWWDKHVMQMTGVKKDDFDKWLADSDHKTKPFADYYRTKMAETVSNPADQMMADVADRQASAAQIEAAADERRRIVERLQNEPTTGDNAVGHLSDAYKLGDKETIRDIVDRVRDIVKADEEIMMDDNIDPDWVEDYDGNDPDLLAQKFIVRLSRHYFTDYDDDIPYIVTGIESPKDRPHIPESIRYAVEAFLVNDRKLGKGELKGDDLHKAMRQQNEMAANIQPMLSRLSDEQLDQTAKALGDFPDTAPVIAVQMEQEKRAEKQEAIDKVMADVEKRKGQNMMPVQPSISETDMQYMDEDQLTQRRHKAKADLMTSADLLATNSRLKPGGPKYEQLVKNILQAEADINAINEEIERRANFDQYDYQIENGVVNEPAPEPVVRQLSTKAVIKVLDDAKVPIKQVSQEEADQMMELFTAMNQQAITDYAIQMRESDRQRYAVINVRDPYAVPWYFEKKKFADEYRVWGNRMGGKFQTLDLDKAQQQGDELKQAANIQAMSDLWHGSGAVFTKFDHSHIGEGAGSQAFGWGTYVTNSRDIGEDYSNLTTEGWTYKGKPRSAFKMILNGSPNKNDSIRDILSMLNHGTSFEEAIGKARSFTQSAIKDYEDNKNDLAETDKKDLEVYKAELELINSLKPSDFVKPNRNLYKVEIPDDNGNNYIDWEEEIPAELAQEIRDRIFEFVTTNSEFGWNTTQDHVRLKTELENAIIGKGEKGEDGYPFSKVYPAMSYYLGNSWAGAKNIGAKRASDMLSELGYVGVKYPAGTIMGNGRGATNYVIFNEDDAKIVEHIQFMFDDGAEPQPMFQKGTGGRIYGWTDGKGIFLTPLGMNPNSPMREYTHIWDMYIEKNDPQLWKEMVRTFKQTAAWKEIRENPNYRNIWEDENRMASEVHSRLTGARSQEEFEKAAADPNNKDTESIIEAVRDVLRRFWEKIAGLFGHGRDRLEEFVLMPLRDALKGFNPITGDETFDPTAMIVQMSRPNKYGLNESDPRGKAVSEIKKQGGSGVLAGYADKKTGDYVLLGDDARRMQTLGGKGVMTKENGMDALRMTSRQFDDVSPVLVHKGYRIAIADLETTERQPRRSETKSEPQDNTRLRGLMRGREERDADYLQTLIGQQKEYIAQLQKAIPREQGLYDAWQKAIGTKDEDAARSRYEKYYDNHEADVRLLDSARLQLDDLEKELAGKQGKAPAAEVRLKVDRRPPVQSLIQGELFSDKDFEPLPEKKEEKQAKSTKAEQPAAKKAEQPANMSDEDLLKAIGETDGKARRKYIDAYDQRHLQEQNEENDAYYEMLDSSETTLEDAYGMYDSVFRQFKDGGYASPERTKLLAQIDALESYIEWQEEREAERRMEEEEEAEAAQQATVPDGAKQKFEQQQKEVRPIGFDLTQMRLRHLEEGETCHVERRYVENGTFSFTGKERIESIDDVAYIFKQLEDAAVENTFLVLEKDGVPTIIHLATGLYTASYANADPALAAYNELQPDKVYFIHNHPSGNLKCSKPDEDVLRNMKNIFGDKLQPGIIIDTKSGKYGLFGMGIPVSPSTQNKMPEKVEGEVPMKVYSFSKQVFDQDWNPETAFDAETASKVAQFVSSHRLGDHKKTSLLVMTQNWKVTGNVFLPWTTLKEAVTAEAADLIARYMNQMGGTIVTLYGDYDFNDADKENLQELKSMLQDRRVYLADVVHVEGNNYKSAHEMGMVGEPGADKPQGDEGKMYRHTTPEIEKANARFNQELDRQINDPAFPKDHVYKLGKPGAILLSTGFPNDNIEMSASHLLEKSKKTQHPFDLQDVKNLVKAINNPVAVFSYGDKDKSQNVIVEMQKDGKNFMVGIHFKQGYRGNVVSDIRGIFPRDNSDWINWITQEKHLYLDKEKIQNLIAQQRKILAEVGHLDLNSVAKLIKDFNNPKLSEENLRKIFPTYVVAAEETADMLGGVKVVFESEATEKGTLGWYDPNNNTVHVVLPEHSDANEVRRTACHEKLGHEGLVALLGSQDEVDKFGQFVFKSAGKSLRERIIDKADENDPGWKDHLRFSHAAQEVVADIAEEGPRTAEEFSLWDKIKHYLIRFLNKMGWRIRGLINDHDLAYYILKTGEALKKWNQMPESDRTAASRQATEYDIMRARRGKPRKRNDESMAQYLQRLREWEKWKIAEERARENNDPMPDAEQINERWHEQFNQDVAEWRMRNGIPADAEGLGAFPRREAGETPQDYAARVADYETQKDAWADAPKVFDYLQRANEEYQRLYREWKERYGLAEAANVDLGLYEGDPDSLPHIVDPEDLEADMRAEADLAEAVGIDMSREGARRHAKLSLIERRKNLESSNAEDAVWIHDIVNSINMEAYRQGVDPKQLREAMADIIEGTYFEDVIKDDAGNVIAVEDISDRLPIKMTTGLRDILATIKDWYDEFYHVIEDAGLRNDAGYIEEGYVNHVWSKEKSSPEAWKKYVENFQRTKSPNMRERMFKTYRDGRDVGLVPKFSDIADILAYYSVSNNEAVANKKFLDDLSFIVVEEQNGDGEVVSVLPLLNSNKPNIAVSDRYQMYHVPGVGDVYVLKDIQRTFANVFGTMRTQDIPEWLSKTGKVYDTVSSTAKKIELSFSAFHMGALTEVAMAQMRPDRALRALAQYIIFDCAKAGTVPAYAHPEDFKLAASHLVQLGATQDYSAADVNNVTEKLRDLVREMADSEQVAKKGAGYAATPVAYALDMVNKGMDKVLWNYLHDGLKIACFKMFAEQIEKRVEKQGLSAEQREQLLDEAGQYVNDTFGGQYWELLNVSPALIKWLRRGFLSPDWLVSTQRHFLANFGFGSIYSESGFLNYLRYNRDNIKRAFGVDIPRDENRRFRSKNAKQCYLLGVCAFFYVMMNALNAMFRAWDEDREKEKADEQRRENPGYQSPYELAYPDGMKWYDYTMYGNTIGQQTHLFLGRYDDGTEWYARWGKQFREFPELFMGRHGVEFPTPLMERMSGKANPIGRYLLYDLPLTVGMYGYKQPRETQEIAEKYGNTVALLAMTAKKFLPYSVPTQQDKEFKMFDLVMPSQKGFTRWKAVDYFKTYIQGGDMDGVMRTYNAAVMNGIDAEDCLKAAIATVKATQRKELADGITDLQSAMNAYDAEKDTAEKKRLRQKIFAYLAEQDYKAFTRDEAREQVDQFLNGTAPTDNDVNKYVKLATASDVRDEYRLEKVRKMAKKYADEIKTAEGDRQRKLEDTYGNWLDIYDIITKANRDINRLKRQLGKEGEDDAATMDEIRTIRRETQKEVEEIQAP